MSHAAFLLFDWLRDPLLRRLIGGAGLGVLVSLAWIIPPPDTDDDASVW